MTTPREREEARIDEELVQSAQAFLDLERLIANQLNTSDAQTLKAIERLRTVIGQHHDLNQQLNLEIKSSNNEPR